MIDRLMTSRLLEDMRYYPAIAILGSRQVGKTTLARHVATVIEHEQQMPTLYLDLESPEDLFKLNDPLNFLRKHRHQVVILDEIQRVPELFQVLRGLIDQYRREGRTTAQFLLLGSASMELLRQSSQSLAGRISYIELSGFNALEVSSLDNLWLRGGFPSSFLAVSDHVAMNWLENLIKTYLERDIPQTGVNSSSVTLRRLWTMLAHLQGETINTSQLAANLELSRAQVGAYLDVLTNLLLIRRLEPWYVNTKKRLVKSPRYYLRDSGILHRLLGISDYDALLSHPVMGKSWEGFAIENIHSVLPLLAKTYFYRTSAGAEIDLVIHMPNDVVWAIEIKHGSAPRLTKHVHQIFDDVGATHRYLVYGGCDEFTISGGVVVISLRGIMEKLVAWSA